MNKADLLKMETWIIGEIFFEWEAVAAYKTELSPDEFSDSKCRDSWEAFIKSDDQDEWRKLCNAKGLIAFLAKSMDDVSLFTTSSLPWVVGKVKAAARKRRLRVQLQQIWLSEDDDTLVDQLEHLVEDERRHDLTVVDEDMSAKLHARTMAELRNNDLSSRIMTGIKGIDRIVEGLRLGNVSILGAEPSTGKTALALNIAATAVNGWKKVLIFSLEMSAVQMMDRMISAVGEIPYAFINNKALSETQLQQVETVSYSLTAAKSLFIYDTIYDVEQMGSIIARIKPDLVIVDFLQFCRTHEKIQSTADKLEYIVSEFKRLAKVEQHRCHIMLLSQPSRQATREGQSMFALKGSSGIEQGGDVILLLDRPCVRDMHYPVEQAQVRVAKNKFGRTGMVDLYFEGEYQRFRDLREGEIFDRVDVKEVKPW